jgi:hypothetical protein
LDFAGRASTAFDNRHNAAAKRPKTQRRFIPS